MNSQALYRRRSRPGLRRAVALITASLLALPAQAQLFGGDKEAREMIAAQKQVIDQMQTRNRELEQRVLRMEEILKSQGLLELYSQIELLKQEVNKLRGQIEEIANTSDQTARRQKDFYVDLDSRLRRLEQPPAAVGAGVPGATAPGTPGAADPAAASAAGAAPVGAAGTASAADMPAGSAAAAVPADPNAETRTYESAFNLFRIGNYTAAIAAFGNFAKTYPQSPLAPSALYWVGNAYYAMSDFKNAIASQRRMISSYPTAQKVPDALLNIASSQQELNDNANARKTLQEIIAKYPLSEAADKAKRRLAAAR